MLLDLEHRRGLAAIHRRLMVDRYRSHKGGHVSVTPLQVVESRACFVLVTLSPAGALRIACLLLLSSRPSPLSFLDLVPTRRKDGSCGFVHGSSSPQCVCGRPHRARSASS